MAVVTAQSKEARRAPVALNSRRDRWWIKPLLTVIVFTALGVIYPMWRTIENSLYKVEPNLLSPLYSPEVGIHLTIFGWNVSPAIYVVIWPIAFRLTCYYYRLAYYRAYFLDPPACAVQEPSIRKHYTGETRFPFILQNFHRFALYAASVILVFLVWDALLGYNFDGRLGVSLGSLILTANAILLCLYTFSCHSLRHLIGGQVNCFSCSKVKQVRHGLWRGVSVLNHRHSLWAWLSLFSVMATDFYVRLVAAGTIQDFRFF